MDTFTFGYDMYEKIENEITGVRENAEGYMSIADTWQKGQLDGMSVVSSTKRIINSTPVTEERDVTIHLYNPTVYHYYVVLLNTDKSARIQESGWIRR
jgi:hypothetical protein